MTLALSDPNNPSPMILALFDLDNTLLAGDSDYEWGRFLCDLGVVERALYEAENERFYREYEQGRLDIREFLQFAFRPLAAHDMDTLNAWHRQYMAERIRPMINEKGRTLLQSHRDAGHITVIITATNRFVTAPIARELGAHHLIATEAEIVDNRFTGRAVGVPCFKEGKVVRLNAWMAQRGMSLAGSTFYSDSHNDLPLLEAVSRPVAVDPDPRLRALAEERGWEIIRLRGP